MTALALLWFSLAGVAAGYGGWQFCQNYNPSWLCISVVMVISGVQTVVGMRNSK